MIARAAATPTPPAPPAPRRAMLRFSGWFALANAALFLLLGLRYLWHYPFSADPLGILYLVLAFIGHFVSLAVLPAGLVVVPLALAWPRRSVVLPVAVLLATLSLAALVMDSSVFAEQRYHLTPLIVMLFERGTWAFIAVITLTALAFESLLAGYVWRWVAAQPVRGGRGLALLLFLGWFAGQSIHMWADAVGRVSVTQLTRYLPAYYPIHAKRRLAQLGLVSPQMIERQRLLQQTRGAAMGQLRYPLAACNGAGVTVSVNLLIIIVDGLRPDAVHDGLMPRFVDWQAGAAVFANHWSGGNSSRAGLFSLFYGLPSTYEEAFYGVQQPPELLRLLRERGYEFGLFAAPGFGSPTAIDRTIFAGVPGLPAQPATPDVIARNRGVTDDWLAWLARRPADRPFFGFLYYDPPRAAMSADAAEPLPLEERFTANAEARADWRRYRQALRVIDAELGRVFDSVDAAGLAEDTVVVVASDHGYEFDDNGLGYIGHASNYSAAQLRSVLALHWPGRAPGRREHRTSHHDLPVTLLQDFLGCSNDPGDYAIGRNLFAGVSWNWIITGSYVSHAVVEPERVTVAYPGGYVEVLGPDYRPLPRAAADDRVLAEAVAAMRRFYR